MRISCGVDIENRARLTRLFRVGLIPKDIFRKHEWETIQGKPAQIDSYFTVKEAVLKALGYGWFNGPVSGTDIKVTGDREAIKIKLFKKAKEIFLKKGYQQIEILQHEYKNNLITEVFMADNRPVNKKKTIVDISRVKRHLLSDKKEVELYTNGLSGLEHKWCEDRLAGYIAGRIAAQHCILDLMRAHNVSNEIAYGDIKIANDYFGKPFIENSLELKLPIIPAFSISHAKRYAVCIAAMRFHSE